VVVNGEGKDRFVAFFTTSCNFGFFDFGNSNIQPALEFVVVFRNL